MALTLLAQEATQLLKDQAATALEVWPGSGAFFTERFLQRRHWGAVIFEGDFHDADSKISRGLSRLSIDTIYCIGLADYMTDGYSLHPNHYDLAAVRKNYVEPSYLITDELKEFAIVSDSDLYWAIAAGRNQLIALFGDSISPALSEFEQDISAYRQSKNTHQVNIGELLDRFLDRSRKSCRQLGLENSETKTKVHS